MTTDEDEQTYATFEDWLNSEYSSPKTIQTYHTGVQAFLQYVYNSTDKAETLAPRYLQEVKSRHPVQDLVGFINAMTSRPPKSVKLYTAATRQFLLYCAGVELSQKDSKRLHRRMKGSRAVTEDRAPTIAELRAILLHADVRMRAFILFLASSGPSGPTTRPCQCIRGPRKAPPTASP